MAKRRKYEPWMTTNSRIKSAIQRVWLWSKERKFAIDTADKCCIECGARRSQAKGKEVKLEVHHEKHVDWDRIFRVLREELFTHPDNLTPLCVDCHLKVHGKVRRKK